MSEPASEASAYPQLLAAQRELLNRLAAASLPTDVSNRIAAELQSLAGEAKAYEVDEQDREDGWRKDVAGRGSAVFPEFVVDFIEPGTVRGGVRFERAFLGGHGVVHGGATPLLFDDVLGVAANFKQEGLARTAYLTVNYRSFTLLDVPLRFEATLDRVEGRKRFVTGRLTDEHGTVLADADALFVQLREI